MRTLMMTCTVSLAGLASTTWAGQARDARAASPMVDVRRMVSALPASRAAQPDEAPSLNVRAALDEALARNPRLILLRREYQALQYRPAQALALAPPSFEAQVWQWPFNTLNPGNTDMYMFTVGQALPGRGKGALSAAGADERETQRVRTGPIASTAARARRSVLPARVGHTMQRDTGSRRHVERVGSRRERNPDTHIGPCLGSSTQTRAFSAKQQRHTLRLV